NRDQPSMNTNPAVPIRMTPASNPTMRRRRFKRKRSLATKGTKIFVPFVATLYQILRLDRQLSNALARRAEDSIRHGGSDGRSTGFTDAAGRIRAGHDVGFDYRHLVDAERLVIVEVLLLHAATVDRDLAAQCGAQAIHDSAFDLLYNDRGIHDV